MKQIIIFFAAFFLLTDAIYAQVVDEKPVEKPFEDYNERPYPITNIPVSPEVAGFMAYFHDSDVGNLRVFSSFKDTLDYGYYFKGREIGPAEKELFTKEFHDLIKSGEAYATYNIKGNAGDHYIIRMPTNKGANTLWLFNIEGEVVKPVQLLAYAFCQGDYCYQQDSWITDLDGDADLDILVKFRRTRADTKEIVEKTQKVYLQNEDGDFRHVENGLISFDPSKFEMEDLKY